MRGRCWTPEEDRLLAETVLRSVREGGNQLNAFEEVAEKIERTPGACGFRWNAVLRHKEAEAFRQAKRERVSKKIRKKKDSLYSLKDIIQQLKRFDREYRATKERLLELEQKLLEKENQLKEAEAEHNRLTEEWNAFDNFQNEVKDRYTSLLRLFQTAHNLERMEPHVEKASSTLGSEYESDGSQAESNPEAES
ncbi:RsfA family transcriptional regulator [Melghirimyces algeriensis]|uniref:Transcription factor, RsfA family n=1 Tax=Melghirimyces algeriensis TaxID=910412 RepID=A0A521CJI0_9BACL|nr:RsfA family transcriptional regulator [Melghirimyces algeriensis]SMO59613.1 transcription factor, RsfA family [Melghirimyces algeriensis]